MVESRGVVSLPFFTIRYHTDNTSYNSIRYSAFGQYRQISNNDTAILAHLITIFQIRTDTTIFGQYQDTSSGKLSSKLRLPAHWEQFRVKCLAQGHIDIWTDKTRIQTTHLAIIHTLPPAPQPYSCNVIVYLPMES